jgi:polyhydroxybutyrate depolymerase
MVVLGAPIGCHRPPPSRASTTTSSPPSSSSDLPPLPAETFEPAPLAPGERRPLLIFLHGLGGSGAQLFQFAQLADLGRARRLFVVAPDGTRDRAGRRFWNAGAACCDFDGLPVDDDGRLAALIDWWRAHRAVDPSRIYVAGFSNGGFMAHRLACTAGDRIAAVASIGGAAPDAGASCAVASPIGVLEVHGDADGVVRYDGGRVFDAPALGSFPSAPAGLRAWADRLGCRAPAVDETAASHRVRRAAGCAAGGAELWTIPGGGHEPPSPALVREIWGFLERWARPPR